MTHLPVNKKIQKIHAILSLPEHIEIDVNIQFKIIFVKKQKQTRERPTQGRGATFIYNRNGRFHTREGLFVLDGLSI